ncbi:MAG: ABC transporter permease, partial [Sutterella wadsworthensis]|nr:ABC transporter permease [Sutterella wadsworthensis]
MNRERGRPQLRFGEQLLILLEKEWLQMVRDPAVIFMGALLPVVLIVLFGWGLSMDLLKVPAVFTAGESTALTAEVRAAFRGSPYFELTEVPSRHDAERLFAARRTEVIIDLPPGFTRDAAMGRAQIGLTVHGVDASAA